MEVVVVSSLPQVSGRSAVVADAAQTVHSVVAAFCAARNVTPPRTYITRDEDLQILPARRTLAACGVRDGDVLYISAKGFSDDWPLGCNAWWLLATVALIIGATGLITVSLLKVESLAGVTDYGIVFDAGSSHTAMYVYQWPAEKENGTGIVHTIHNCTVKKSLSSFVNDTSKAGGSLQKCLADAAAKVPVARQHHTQLYLGATAGMRLLRASDNATCQKIMASVRRSLHGAPFNFSDRQARIISGLEEATFSWITVNFLGRKFGQFSSAQPATMTSGALDMGGASTQISFVPGGHPGDLPQNYSTNLRLYGSDYDVYARSYLCFGLNEIHRKYYASLVSTEQIVEDPCAPVGYKVNISSSELFEVPCTRSSYTRPSNDLQIYTFVGQSDPIGCTTNVTSLFATSCNQSCFSDDHQPALLGNFTAFSGYFYAAHFLNLTDGKTHFTRHEFDSAIDHFCKKTWQQVRMIKHVDRDRLAEYCFESRYVYTILTTGYGFNDTNWSSLLFTNQSSSGTELGWALGMMLNATGRIPSEFPQSPFSTTLFILLLFLFLLFVVIAIAFACHARQARLAEDRGLLHHRAPTYGSV